ARSRSPAGAIPEMVHEFPTLLAPPPPRLGELLSDARVRACIDGTITADGAIVQPGHSVEFIPVVSGG
ncbi:MAG: MoaD/ThiS family protein, partial [Qipengyuania sp.]